MRSVSAGHEDVVRELLGAGADVKKTNDKGITALYVPAVVLRFPIFLITACKYIMLPPNRM